MKLKNIILLASIILGTQNASADLTNIGGEGGTLPPAANAAALPTSGNVDGDLRVTLDDQSIYVWKESTTSWIQSSSPAATSAITALNTDVVANGPGAVVATIQANVVSNSKLATMPAHTIKGNNTAGAANASDLTVSQVRTELSIDNIDNTSDANKPVSTAQGLADTAVQNFSIQRANHTGTQTASTISDFTSAAQSAAVTQTITNGVTATAPSEDAVFDALALKAPLASPALTGNPTAPTQVPLDNSTKIATTAYADAAATAGATSILATSIVDGDTTHAPDGNSVFDALALKEPNITATTSADYYRGDKTFQPFASAAQSAVVTQVITNGVTATAPSEDAVFDALALKESTANKDQNNGYAGLDAGGKIAISALPNTVMTFEGQWNANTNTPALANGTGNSGDVWRANVAGSTDFGAGPIAFNLGDWAVYNGTIWEYAANSNLVMSVNGQQGVVVLDTDDIAEGTNLYFTEARVRSTPITGFTSGAGVLSATDTVLQAIEKLDGNINAASSGVAYGMAGFDSAGALYEIPNMFHTDYNGLYGTVQVPVAGDLNILSLSSASGVAPANVNGIFINNQAESTTNTTLLYLNNAAPIGDDFAGMRIFNSGNSVDALTMQSIGNSGNYGGQLRLMEASNSGTGAGGILYNIFNNGAQSGQLTVLNVGDSGNNTADTTLLGLNENGNITGNFQGIGFGTNGDVTGNSTLATIGDNGNVVGGDFMGLNLYGGSTTTGNSLMQNITDNGSSVNKTGVGVSLSGSASNSVNGLYVNVDNVTFAGQKSSGTFSGGIFSSQSNIDTGDFTPPFFTNNNSLGGQLQIDSGSPLLATPMFGNNLGIVVNFDDDYTADDFIDVGNSLGYSVNGFVNQVTGASGKTMDTLNYMFAAGSNPTGAGTIENVNFFRAGGLLNAGGTLTATNQRAFYVDPVFDDSVATTNKWGFINDSSSDNFFKKSVTIGGPSKVSAAGVGLEVYGHQKSSQVTAPTATPNANAGTGATCSVSGTDTSGSITLVTGSGAWATGAQCDVTFDTAYATAPKCTITATNSNAAAAFLNVYISKSTTDLTLNFVNPDNQSNAITWDYHCVETN